jgi:anti-sigma regulatory factor (Ser/Thr protein kinase)
MKRRLTFRRKVILIVAGLLIGTASLLVTSGIASRLRDREQSEVRLWTLFLVNENMFHPGNPAAELMERNESNIPFVVVDGSMHVRYSHLIDSTTLSNPDLLRRTVVRLGARNPAIPTRSPYGEQMWVYYGSSHLRQLLVYFPIVQILVLVIFVMFGYVTVRSSRDDEQNRVWIGLAKETAHQLGTPTSSLLGWLEYLRSQPVDQGAVDEMGNDLSRLMKVVERFSKIGSETVLSPSDINEVVGGSVDYFRSRVPRNVTLSYNGLAIAPVSAMINEALFEWVVENLLKNSLDALQGTGTIDVNLWSDDEWVYIDVSDTGRGIAKSNWRRIFEPGFTTKTRGWGLGLSLSKRIIEDYHKGRIFVVDSEAGRGTTIRISLLRVPARGDY